MLKQIKDMIIAVDFDGTLCEDKYPDIGIPKDTFYNIRHYKELGATLILNTCRNGELLRAAVEWCKRRGLTFDYVNENAPSRIKQYGGDTRKISADLYIDDKAITPCEFSERTKSAIQFAFALAGECLDVEI